MTPFCHVLAPTDFSVASRHALATALMMAQRFGARLTLLHVVEPQFAAYAGAPFMPIVNLVSEQEAAARIALEREMKALEGQTIVDVELRHGSAWREILEAAKDKNADLIVMSTHGHTGLARALMGSTAEKVVRMSGTPVLTVHALPTP